ncbi:MAG TPA: hypothetical protein VES65_03880 [Solirubrobacteraceae bacterium]|nr:hypothetical protein [Solirubrobacteraceae bacterium]
MNVAMSRLLPAATVLALALGAPAQALPATTPAVTTPASAKIGQPTTISPTPVKTAPATAVPVTPATTTVPATTAPAATAPATSGASPPTYAPSTIPLPGSAATRSDLGRFARARTRSSGKVSTEAVVLAAIGALLVLACSAWAFARSRAFEPHWLLSLRHALAEAGFRTSATWAEFSDWVRLGR